MTLSHSPQIRLSSHSTTTPSKPSPMRALQLGSAAVRTAAFFDIPSSSLFRFPHFLIISIIPYPMGAIPQKTNGLPHIRLALRASLLLIVGKVSLEC